MSTPTPGSSSSGRRTRCHNRRTQRAVTQTRGTQREEASRGHQRERTSTPVGDQHPLQLSQEELAKIAELVVRQLPTSTDAAQTAVAALVSPTSLPAATVVQSSLTISTSLPAVTVAQLSLTTPPAVFGTTTLIHR